MAEPFRTLGSSLTDKGRARENNEDALLFDLERGVYAVSDGMGGHASGEVASSMAIEALRQALDEIPDQSFLADPSLENRGRLLAWLNTRVAAISREIYSASRTQTALWGMGCTLDLALLRGGDLFLAHVGDSRVYLLRGGHLQLLTEDHTFGQMLLDDGASPEQVARAPQRKALTRALGLHPNVQVDTLFVDLDQGDLVLLCSDGLYEEVSEAQLTTLLAQHREHAAQPLIDAALEAGARDNVTAVVFSLEHHNRSTPVVIGAEATLAALARSSLFQDLSHSELLRVQRIAEARSAPAGTTLTVEGDSFDGVYLLLSGTASVWLEGAQIGQFEPGDPFGEYSLIDLLSPVTVRTETAVELLHFPKDALVAMVQSDSSIGVRLLRAAMRRFAARMRQMASLIAQQKKAEER